MSTVIDAIAALYGADATGDGMLSAAARQLHELGAAPFAPEDRRELPVCGYLATALAAAAQGPLATIAAAFAEIEPGCRWRQNPNYTAATIGQAFMDGYGYVELVGRDRLWPDENLAVGFLLLGPGRHYPPHSHPAAEVYHVVSGTAEWGRNGQPMTPRAPGAAIYHAPGVVHETRAGDAPLLALYCWHGAIEVAARLKR